MSFQSPQCSHWTTPESSLQILFVSSATLVDSLSLNKCIHYHDGVIMYVVNHILCNTSNSLWNIFLSSHAEASPYRLTQKNKIMIKIKSSSFLCHTRVEAVSGMLWCLDETEMIGWSQLGRRSHWNTNQSMLSKATSHPINWHSLFRMIIYPGLIPGGGACVYVRLCVCVCENPDRFVLFVTFSAGGKERRAICGLGVEKWTGS